jgi:hypothetical protein
MGAKGTTIFASHSMRFSVNSLHRASFRGFLNEGIDAHGFSCFVEFNNLGAPRRRYLEETWFENIIQLNVDISYLDRGRR